MRFAWFSPWPPQTTGIAGRSVEVTRVLADRGAGIDVFVDRKSVPSAIRASNAAPSAGEVRVQSAHDFVWRHHRGQYDLVVYQIGNSTAHTFIWPYLMRYPGLTIVHDAHLHHARGAAMLQPLGPAAYRAALALDHPGVPPEVAELAIAGFDGSYYYLWPMVRTVLLASRAVGSHTRGGVALLRDVCPDTLVDYVALGMGRATPSDDAGRAATRASLGIPADALLIGTFGGLTFEKRVPEIVRAFAGLRRVRRDAHLLLAGTPDPRLELRETIASLGLDDAVTLAPSLDDDTFEDAIAAVDVSLNLRWPTARETSGPWLQAMAAGRATIVFDLEHHAHVPLLDPQTWLPRPTAGADAPVAVGIDLMDELRSLDLAMARLATDERMRTSLGAAARAYWEREHTLQRMADDCERIIERALTRPAESRLPATALIDPCRTARELAGPPENLTCALF